MSPPRSWFVYAAILLLPVRGALAYLIANDWGNVPVQIVDGLAAGAMGVATPLMVQRFTQGSGRFNTALGFVMALQGVGAALSPTLANTVVGAEQQFGLAFVALPMFCWAQRGCTQVDTSLKANARLAPCGKPRRTT